MGTTVWCFNVINKAENLESDRYQSGFVANSVQRCNIKRTSGVLFRGVVFGITVTSNMSGVETLSTFTECLFSSIDNCYFQGFFSNNTGTRITNVITVGNFRSNVFEGEHVGVDRTYNSGTFAILGQTTPAIIYRSTVGNDMKIRYYSNETLTFGTISS